jgi:hypothetical protein
MVETVEKNILILGAAASLTLFVTAFIFYEAIVLIKFLRDKWKS